MGHEKYDPRKTEQDEFDNYWNYGENGNREDYEKYLMIKSRIEGRPYRRPRRSRGGSGTVSLTSWYPLMRPALFLLFFEAATRVAVAYLAWESAGVFAFHALSWVLGALAVRWYFARRDGGNGMLFLNAYFCPDRAFPSLLIYGAFLVGLLLATVSPDDVKVWAILVEHLAARIGYPLDCGRILSLPLPGTPFGLRSLGSWVAAVSGGTILADALAYFLAARG